MTRRLQIPGRRTTRVATLAVVVVAVLAAAPTVSAAFKPLLTAASSGPTVTLSYSQPASNDGPGTLTLHAPSTYVAKLPTQVGAVVGTATGNAVAADIRGSTMPLAGTIRVADASGSTGSAARACAGGDTIAGAWSLTLNGFNQALPLLIAVQRLGSAVVLGICLPPADLPVGTAGRSPLGLKIVQLTLRLTSVFTVPSGTHAWHLKATPYSPGTANLNPAAAVEAEAEHATPQTLTLAARTAGANRSSVSGRLTLAGKGVGGRTVRIIAGSKQVGTARTGADGSFATTVTLTGARPLVIAKVVVPARYLTACASPAFAPLPCATSIVAGFAATARARIAS